jgi:predicted site-specific integrase-resolvase
MNEQKEDGRMFISIREAVAITGLCNQTLRKLADQNKIKTYKTMSGQRKFDKKSLQEMCNPSVVVSTNEDNTKQNFIYTRVSSKNQLDDISRQIEFIKTKNTEYNLYTIISDIGSGINFKRKGLSTILECCMKQNIGNIVITHKDRLSRFGFDLIDIIVQKSGGKIIIIDDEKNKSTEQELSEDLLSIVHIYSCK